MSRWFLLCLVAFVLVVGTAAESVRADDISEIEALIQGGELRAALGKVESALKQDPRNEYLEQLRRDILVALEPAPRVEPASAPAPKPKSNDRARLNALREAISQEKDPALRTALMTKFVDAAAPYLRTHPKDRSVALMQAVAAMELNRETEGRSAGWLLKQMGAEASTDPQEIRVMAQLSQKGWIPSEDPEAVLARAAAARAREAAEVAAKTQRTAAETRKLAQAFAAGDVQGVRDALARGADTLQPDAQGRTMLIQAAAMNNVEMLELVLGNNPESLPEQDHAGKSVLFHAIAVGNPRMVELLLTPPLGNANLLNVTDQGGRTPLEFARASGSTEIVAELEAAAAAKRQADTLRVQQQKRAEFEAAANSHRIFKLGATSWVFESWDGPNYNVLDYSAIWTTWIPLSLPVALLIDLAISPTDSAWWITHSPEAVARPSRWADPDSMIARANPTGR